jgi:hypothetical protein
VHLATRGIADTSGDCRGSGRANMNGFDAFFPSSSAPRNPYRHAEFSAGSAGGSGPRRRGAAGRSGASATSLQDRVFIVVGTLFCFLLFVAYKTLPGSSAAAVNAASPLGAANGVLPRLKGGLAAEAVATPPVNLKVMTFNLRFAGANDGFNGWSYRREHVADIINRYHPAVMGTQEGLKDQLAELQVSEGNNCGAQLLVRPY